MNSTKDMDNLTQKDRRVQRTRKKSGKKNRLIRTILIIFAFLYLPALWNWIFHDSIDTEIMNSGLIEMRISNEGVFVREESAVKSPKEGIVIPEVNQNERIPNNSTIAVMVDKNNKQTLQRIEKIEKDIIRHAIEEYPDRNDREPEFNSKIQNEVNKLTKPAINKTMQTISEIAITFERMLYQRNKEIFSSKDGKLYLQNEKDELQKLQNSIKEDAVEIKAGFAGLVVWDDLYDEKYTPANIELLTQEDLSYKEEQDINLAVQSINTDDYFTAKENQTIARLVNNEKTWYVCIVDLKKAEEIKLGDELFIKLSGTNDTLPCLVESIREMGDKAKVVLAINRMVEETIHLRYTKSDLIIRSVSGLKVPQRSLTNINTHDSTADIILVRLNRAVIKRVKILAQQDAVAIISALPDSKETDPVRIFDIFVVNPQNIVEGQVIE